MTGTVDPCPHVCAACPEHHKTTTEETGTSPHQTRSRLMGDDVHVIPNAGTLLIDEVNGDGPAHAATVRRVLGTLIIDDDAAILHAEDGTRVVLASEPAGVAFIRTQAGLPGGQPAPGDQPTP